MKRNQRFLAELINNARCNLQLRFAGGWDGVLLGAAVGLGAWREIVVEPEVGPEKHRLHNQSVVILNFLFHTTLEGSTDAAEDANMSKEHGRFYLGGFVIFH